MIYFISDLYFGHRNVIGMDGGSFETIEDMDETSERTSDGRMLNGYRPVTLVELIENNRRFQGENSSEEERL